MSTRAVTLLCLTMLPCVAYANSASQMLMQTNTEHRDQSAHDEFRGKLNSKLFHPQATTAHAAGSPISRAVAYVSTASALGAIAGALAAGAIDSAALEIPEIAIGCGAAAREAGRTARVPTFELAVDPKGIEPEPAIHHVDFTFSVRPVSLTADVPR